jgi:hypothetical protein
LASDSKETIEFLLQELLFKLVQSQAFNKSEKVRIFNEKTLSSLIKLFEWTDSDSQDSESTLTLRQIGCEFLKILFSSHKHGISFYDKSLNVDQSPKNLNHLIFNALISIVRPSLAAKAKDKSELVEKTNELIDSLTLKTLKVCPDLIQRYLKVKLKQSQQVPNNQIWFTKFATQVFEQQSVVVRNMRKNFASSTSFMRSIGQVNIQNLCDLNLFF